MSLEAVSIVMVCFHSHCRRAQTEAPACLAFHRCPLLFRTRLLAGAESYRSKDFFEVATPVSESFVENFSVYVLFVLDLTRSCYSVQ